MTYGNNTFYALCLGAAATISIVLLTNAAASGHDSASQDEATASTPYQIAAEAGEALANSNTGFNIWAGWEENNRPDFDELEAELRDQYGAQDVVFTVSGFVDEAPTVDAFCVTASTSNSSAFYSSETGETVTGVPFFEYECGTPTWQ